MSIRKSEPERETLFVCNVKVPEQRARGLDPVAVTRLAESMAELGLQTPITVRDDGEWPVLVAGLHRLKAAEHLGWEKIDAIYLEGDERDARLWEISENLHRADLSAVERAEHIDEWRQLTLTKVRQVAAPWPGGQQPGEQGHRKTADALGISERSVRRAEAIATLSDDLRDQAREERWPQERLLDLARGKEAEDARRLNREADKLISAQRIDNATQWLSHRLAATELHALGEMLAGVCAPLSKALLREAQ
jgi:ParB-like chromosome segregation protein Spo0J